MAKPMIVDTGFLVALYIRGDALHRPAVDYLCKFNGRLNTVPAVIVETCFFLDSLGKVEFLKWVSRGALIIQDIPLEAHYEIAQYINKYADQEIDFADAALVWLANEIKDRSILTVDETDFLIYRLKGNKRFDLVKWY
ncbi:type II toxin-antitoxin system VapC family toxin [Methylomagnum sp.]